MNIATDPQVVGLVFDAAGIFVLGIPAVFRMSQEIQAQASTRWNYNRDVVIALSSSRIDITAGSVLLLAGFISQLVGTLEFVYAHWYGLLLLITCAAFLASYFLGVRSFLANLLTNSVCSALDKRGAG